MSALAQNGYTPYPVPVPVNIFGDPAQCARVEGSIATGGTAQWAFGTTPICGFEIVNTHATETLYIREAAVASGSDNGPSVPIPPRGSYSTPAGYRPTGDVSVVSASTGHAFIARRW